MSAPCQCRGPGLVCGAAGYNSGCRCDYCRESNNTRMRAQYRARQQREIPPDVAHGRYTTWQNWSCRCGPCREARGAMRRPYIRQWRVRTRERAKQHPEIIAKARHGTRHSYATLGCRCDECKRWRRDEARKYRRRRRERAGGTL